MSKENFARSTSFPEPSRRPPHQSGEFPAAKARASEDEDELIVNQPSGATGRIKKNSPEDKNATYIDAYELKDTFDTPPEVPKSIREQSILDAARSKLRQRSNLNPHTKFIEALKQSVTAKGSDRHMVFHEGVYKKAHDQVSASVYQAMDRDPENVSNFVQRQVEIAGLDPETLIQERMKGLKIDSRDPRLKELMPAIQEEITTLEQVQRAIEKSRQEKLKAQDTEEQSRLRRNIQRTPAKESTLDFEDSLALYDLMSTAQVGPIKRLQPYRRTEKQKGEILEVAAQAGLSETTYKMSGRSIAQEQQMAPFEAVIKQERLTLKSVADKLAGQGIIVDLPWQVKDFQLPAQSRIGAAVERIAGFFKGFGRSKPKEDGSSTLMETYRASAKKYVEAREKLEKM